MRIIRSIGMASALLAITAIASADSVKRSFPAVAIRGAKIVVKPGDVIEQGNIVIRDGVITDVGAGVEIPFDAEIIEGAGLTAYPGLIDASSPVGIPKDLEKSRISGSGDDIKIDITRGAPAAMREVNRNGIFPDYAVARQFKLDAGQAKSWREAGFTLVHAAPVDALLSGTSALVLLIDDEDSARRDTVVDADVAMMAGWRSRGGGYPRSLMGTISHLRQTMLDAQHYAESWRLYNESKDSPPHPTYDAAMEALLPVLRGEMPVVFPANSLDEIHRALNFAKEFDLKPIIEGGREAYKAVDRLKEESVPVILHIDLGEKPKQGAKQLERLYSIADRYNLEIPKEAEEAAKKADRNPKLGEPERAYQDRLRIWNEQAGCAKTLLDAGIPFAISTRGNKDTKKFQENLRYVIEAGLSKEEALHALTIAPAEIFGLPQNLGTIEQGRYGNVALVEGEFADKKAKTKYVLAAGKIYDLTKPEPEQKKGEEKSEEQSEEKQIAEGEEAKEKAEEAEPSEETAEKKEAKATIAADWAVETDADRVPQTKTGGNVLIKNATVLTMTRGTFEATSILIEDGIITEIGQNIDAPRGVTVIDGTGAWVLPGIIDCHSHMSISGGVNEATDSITAMCNIEDVVMGDDLTMHYAAAGGVTTANLLHGSANTIGGQRAIVQMKYNRPYTEVYFDGYPRGIKFALGENVTRSRTRFPNTRMGVEATIRRAFKLAQAYQAEWDAYNALSRREKSRTLPPRRDLRLEALAGVLDGSILVHCHSYNADEIAMVMSVLEEFGVKNLTLEHALEAYKVGPEVANFGLRGAFVSTFADNWAYKIEAYDAIPYNAALIELAGGVPIMNSDSGERVRRMNMEAAKAVRFGSLSFEDALQTVTLNPAMALGIDDKVGSIEVGKRGDLALWNGHPLNVYSRAFMTLIDGEVVFERPGERGGPYPLEEKSARAPAVLPPKSASGVYAVVNANIHPVSSAPIPNGTIVFENGIIRAVGSDVTPPSGATVIDAKGMSIYPGLIDGGSPLGLNEISALSVTTDASESGLIQPDLRASVAVKPDSELIPVARFTGITSSVSHPTGGLIPGQSALIQLDGWTPQEMAYIDTLALELVLPRGAGNIDIGALLSQEESSERRPSADEQLQRIQKLFERARQYERALSEAARLGETFAHYEPDLEALVPYVRKERPVVIAANSAEDLLEAIDFAKKLDVNAILRGADEGWKIAGKIAEAGLPVILGPVYSMPSDSYDPYDSAYFNAAKLDEAGVKIAFQSGSESDARNLPFEAGMAVAYGLPREVAIRALTLNTAEIFGVADRVGSLEPGKRADFIVVDGDPLQVVCDIRHMFINGQPVDLQDNKHTRLYEKYRERILGLKGPEIPSAGN